MPMAGIHYVSSFSWTLSQDYSTMKIKTYVHLGGIKTSYASELEIQFKEMENQPRSPILKVHHHWNLERKERLSRNDSGRSKEYVAQSVDKLPPNYTEQHSYVYRMHTHFRTGNYLSDHTSLGEYELICTARMSGECTREMELWNACKQHR